MAALILTLAVAVGASVLAVWPIVADAPWEEEVAAPTPARQQEPTADSTDRLRCQSALDLRNNAITQGLNLNEAGRRAFSKYIQAEIDKYC